MADYCTVSELKSALRITDSVDDTLLTNAVTAASRFIDGYCQRDFTAASGTATKDYIPSGMLERLPIDDCTAIVSVKIDDDLDGSFGTTLVSGTDYQAEPVNSEVSGLTWPYTSLVPLEDGYWPIEWGRATVRVEATYGWSAVPSVVNQAAIMQASRIFTRYDSPLGVAGFGEMGAMRVSRFMDPDVQMLLNPYRRLRF